jgi:uncharacterized protein YrzB (UPF0473 family)
MYQSKDCVNKGGFFMSDNKCNGCGHEHDCEDMGSIIELTGENGDTLNVEFLASVQIDEQEYAIMQTLEDDDEDEGNIVIMRMEYDDDEDEYYLIAEDDQEIMERAFEAFKDSAFDLFEEDDYEEEE